MTDTEFFAVATLAASDRCGIARVLAWEKSLGGSGAAEGWVSRERKSRPDPNDVRPIVLIIAEAAMSA